MLTTELNLRIRTCSWVVATARGCIVTMPSKGSLRSNFQLANCIFCHTILILHTVYLDSYYMISEGFVINHGCEFRRGICTYDSSGPLSGTSST